MGGMIDASALAAGVIYGYGQSATCINFDFSKFITSFNLIQKKDRQILVDEPHSYEATFRFMLLFLFIEAWGENP